MHPKLILLVKYINLNEDFFKELLISKEDHFMFMLNAMQKLVEEFVKKVDAGIRREIHYWHSYYVSTILVC